VENYVENLRENKVLVYTHEKQCGKLCGKLEGLLLY